MPVLTSLPKIERGQDSLVGRAKQPFSISLPPLKQSFGAAALSHSPANYSSDDKFGLKHEWDGVATESLWQVKGEDLEMVPWEFPLERTHREIRMDVGEVASRISERLRLMSVEAEYCSKQAKAKCKTTDAVSFRIRLFAGGEDGQPVVVELQRRSGSASSFMRTCRAVLDAAEGKDSGEKPSVTSNGAPPVFKLPVSSMSCLAHVVTADAGLESDAKEALQGALKLFRSDQRDASLLGLENLWCLSDPVKTSAGVATFVCKSLIAPGDVREELRVLIEHDVFSVEENDPEGSLKFREHQRFLCLRVFANAISVCFKNGSLKDLVSDSWFAEIFVPLLLDELNRAETGLHNAFQAAICLHGLLSSSPSTLHQVLVDNGANAALEKAFKIGQSRHELLACESRRCLDVLDASS
ncbi:hypothetical protein FisN_12Lh373 [Fistulifera solaris]|jgi:hypothetical protein|uniref:Uncharacterized protein n=1 Tax=Fistulifera solaris TaxID=1519565 RepID=A0A1Z5JLN1_FISSO|nr:hypothetical protein FisN_12Lh373 [Fistulifera solaris]|eukprot:GAX14925.1 hypothetical protein FisN_12Lh373 [Fistulifera solaris]